MCIDLEFVPLDGFGVSFQKKTFEVFWNAFSGCVDLTMMKVKASLLEFAQCSWQGEKLYDPDWWLSVQQRRWLAAWKTDCLTAGVRAFQVCISPFKCHFGSGSGGGLYHYFPRWRKYLWWHFQWWRLCSSPHPGKVVLQCKKFFWKNSVTFKWFWICVSLYNICASTLTTSATGRCRQHGQ